MYFVSYAGDGHGWHVGTTIDRDGVPERVTVAGPFTSREQAQARIAQLHAEQRDNAADAEHVALQQAVDNVRAFINGTIGDYALRRQVVAMIAHAYGHETTDDELHAAAAALGIDLRIPSPRDGADHAERWVARHEPTGIERGFNSCAAAERWVELREDGDEYVVERS